jgi:hypothetical protein
LITRLFIGIAALSLLVFSGASNSKEAKAADFVFETQMFGTNQVPPVQTVGWGFFRFFLNEDRSAADVTIDLKGLAGAVVLSSDIHRGAPGTNGPVVKHLADGGYIVTSAHVTFTQAEIEEMAAGNWYISMKTTNYPDGELRGQILPPAGFLPAPPPPAVPVPSAAPPAVEVPQRPAPQAPRPQTPAGGLIISPPNTGDGGLAR